MSRNGRWEGPPRDEEGEGQREQRREEWTGREPPPEEEDGDQERIGHELDDFEPVEAQVAEEDPAKQVTD